jgi:HK97 family phage portal protein
MFEKIKGLFSIMSTKNQKIQLGKWFNQGVSFMTNDSETILKNGYQKNTHVYAVINRIIRTMSRIRVDLFKRTNKGEFVKLEDHPALKLINNPNPKQGYSEFMENLAGYKLAVGEVFIHIVWPDMGVNAKKPKELHIIPPMMVSKLNFDSFGEVISYVVGYGHQAQEIDAKEMIHLSYWNPDHTNPRGMSPISAAIQSLQTSNDAYTSAMKSMQNGGPSGILSGVNDGYQLSAEEAGAVQEKFMQTYGGVDNSGKIIVTGATLKWEAIGLSPVDLQLIDQQKMSMRDICNIYGVSSRLFNDPEANNGSTQKEVRTDLIVNVAEPELASILDEFTRGILPLFRDGELCYKTNTSDFQELKADLSEQTTALNTAWWLTPNQKLQEMGKETSELDEMDKIYLPQGLLPIDANFDDLTNAHSTD